MAGHFRGTAAALTLVMVMAWSWTMPAALTPSSQDTDRRGSISSVLTLPIVHAFVVSGTAPLSATSVWEYDSNLGKAEVRLVDVRKASLPPGARPGSVPSTFYRWRLSVRGLVYEELLELREGQWLTWERSASAFGGLYRDVYSYPVPEFGMPEPLKKGPPWHWQGEIRRGEAAKPPGLAVTDQSTSQPLAQPGRPQSGPSSTPTAPAAAGSLGQARASGQVVGWETINVPAGQFEAWHVHLERSDTFGTFQSIEVWVNPAVGVVQADGDLFWGGVIGKVQRLIGFDHFSVRLKATNVH